MLTKILTVIHIFCAFCIVALVLLQRGRGADAGAGFGAGASGTVFGARGARTALSRTTAILAAVFMATSLSLAYVGTRAVEEPASILDKAAADQAGQPPASAPVADPTASVPTLESAAPAPAAPAGGAGQ